MPSCEEAIFSEEYYDLILETGARYTIQLKEEACRIVVDSQLTMTYVSREGMPKLSIEDYTYSAIPNCFSTLNTSALEASNILKVQNIPTLDLRGEGVLIGFLDTGIDYTNPIFQSSDGKTRIAAIWDQTQQGGKHPKRFPYGTEYTREEIDRALQQDDPYTVVEQRDTDGHGTYVASVAAGSEDVAADFIGAAPRATIAMVKLKRAKQYLYDFWHLNPDTECYQENDLIMAATYLNDLAQALQLPLVLCVTVGSNLGNRGGSALFDEVLNGIGALRQHAVVTAAGNEGGARHHFSGDFSREDKETNNLLQYVEIAVGKNVSGFVAELWAVAPELYSVEVLSPTGERVPRQRRGNGEQREYQFVLENTRVSISYRIVGIRAARQLIFIRFTNPTEGVWTLFIYPEQIFNGIYQIYLPMTEHLTGEVIFLDPSPNETITLPGIAEIPMTASGYDDKKNGAYINSSRGFTETGRVKPDFAAPAVNVYGAGLRKTFQTATGTSVAAAITAGAVALFMEWAAVRGNEPDINCVDVKNYFLRGTRRRAEGIYPNRIVGYGLLDLLQVFYQIRLN